jgi:hypothetical protein
MDKWRISRTVESRSLCVGKDRGHGPQQVSRSHSLSGSEREFHSVVGADAMGGPRGGGREGGRKNFPQTLPSGPKYKRALATGVSATVK